MKRLITICLAILSSSSLLPGLCLSASSSGYAISGETVLNGGGALGSAGYLIQGSAVGQAFLQPVDGMSSASYRATALVIGDPLQNLGPLSSFAVTFSSGGNGSLTGATSQAVASSGNATAVTAVPATGYHFVDWTGTGGFATTSSNPLTVTNVTAVQSITAHFAADAVTGVCGSSDGGRFFAVPIGKLCAAGTPSSVSGTGPYNWTCGSTGCSAVKAVDPTPITVAPTAPDFTNVKAGTIFTILRSEGGKDFTPVQTDTSSTSYTDSSALKPNTVYRYAVTTRDDPTETIFMTIRTSLYNGWNVLAVPYDTVGVATTRFFTSPVSAIYEWVPSGASRETDTTQNGHYTTVTTLTPGKGYFVKASNSSTLLVYSGTPGNRATVILKPGWTLISNPSTANMSNLGSSWTVDGVTLSAAVNAGTLGGSIFWWNGSAYDFWTIASNPPLEPWKAYWIVNQTGNDHTLTIQ